MSKWDVVYKSAYNDDGTLFFPERLTHEFLDSQRRVMGSYYFANQYENKIIPEGDQTFKKNWIRYYNTYPKSYNTFAFVDPAISQEEHSDYTALTVVKVDEANCWYVCHAQRYKITPTELIELLFKTNSVFQPQCIGVEDVAYQKALLYMADQEMRRRNILLPLKGIKASTEKTKQMRIRGLVPRFEWSRIFLAQGMIDLETELAQFPRGKNDDLLDSLAYIESIAFPPVTQRRENEKPNPNDPGYESWYIKNIHRIEREKG